MNPKFILPASLAATAHVFFLFGLPGRAPAVHAPDPADLIAPDDSLKVEIEALKPEPAANEPGNLDDNPGPKVGVPTLPDVPLPPDPLRDVPTIDPGPLVNNPGPGDLRTVPVAWTPRGPGEPVVVGRRDLDREPRTRVQPAPVYPADLRNRGLTGTVVVEFLVDEGGNVYNPAVIRGGERGFEEAALRAVVRWKFEPGLKNGRRVRFRMSVPIVFSLDHP